MFHSFYLFQQSDSSTRGKARLQTEDDHIIIFYNRVPKTGSTSLMGVLYALCRPNRFHALHLNVSRNSHVMSLSDQIRFARNITTWKQVMPAVYHGHLAYMDFQRLGVYQSPLFINMIRKPLDRLVSYYYFLRFGDDFRPYLRRTRQGDKEVWKLCLRKCGGELFEICLDFVNFWTNLHGFWLWMTVTWILLSIWVIVYMSIEVRNNSKWLYVTCNCSILKHTYDKND